MSIQVKHSKLGSNCIIKVTSGVLPRYLSVISASQSLEITSNISCAAFIPTAHAQAVLDTFKHSWPLAQIVEVC
ncbi:hypothetical protein HGG78_18060 [Vibrio aestuarianus]|uniref:hypothetical protein n=1 Tax=Vibrio aestuarianus TaxID=28171 RepID=UPI00155924DC|nr:hypothetical protein [Vibrio aestuarianus]NGZ15622.1 hypothetical protein [Vibrio aestuarianus]NKZ51770.1 hypothetical protein [Vibrio aestuarianus]